LGRVGRAGHGRETGADSCGRQQRGAKRAHPRRRGRLLRTSIARSPVRPPPR
jgi:hypothetical protein